MKRVMQLAAMVAAVVWTAVAAAQPLADRVPEDAMIYIAWQGTEAMPEGFDRTHLKGVLDASNLPQLFETLMPSVLGLVGREDPQAAQQIRIVSGIIGPMLRYPSAFYFGGIDMAGPPMPRAALMVQAGDEAAALHARIATILREAGADLPVVLERREELVIVRIGELPADETLAASPRFTQALGRTGQRNPVAVVYVDVERVVGLVDDLAAMSDDPEAQRNWPIVRDSSGLSGVNELIWAGGFHEREWAGSLFIGAPAPRRGLVSALLEMPALSDEALDVVPRDAVLASAARFDPARVFNEIVELIRQLDPDGAEEVDAGLDMLHGVLGVDLREVLEALGDEWLVYAAPQVGGSGMLGMVAVNRLRDAERFERALGQLADFANQQLAMIGDGNDAPRFRMARMQVGAMTVHHFPLPLVAPAMAVEEGHLYMALYPQVLVAAAEHVSGGGASIRENEKFMEVRRRAGEAAGERLAGINFMDLPATAGEAYQSILMLSQLYLGLAEIMGMEVPPMVIPPLNRLLPHLAPSGGASWSDEHGIYMRSISPFPAAELLGMQQNMMIGQQALMVSILLPSLNRARETANRVRCGSNLRQIGLAAIMYSNEHRNQLPPDLGAMLLTQDITIDVFICPSTSTGVPHGLTLQQQADWVNRNADYVWLGAGMTNRAGSETIIAHERFGNHGRDGVNVLFGDASVQFMPEHLVRQRLSVQRQR